MGSGRSSSSRAWARRTALVAVSLCAVAAVMPASAVAGGVRNMQMLDRCDPASFNARFGDGICTLRNGGVPVGQFLERLNPKDGGHSAWRFSPGQGRPGAAVNNRGGETHSFTEVVDFGGGIIEPLNAVFPPGTPLATPIGDPRFMDAGTQLEVSGLSAGTHRFECLIHPWMQTTIDQT